MKISRNNILRLYIKLSSIAMKAFLVTCLSLSTYAIHAEEKNFSIIQYKGTGDSQHVETGVDIASGGGMSIIKGQANVQSANNTVSQWFDSHRPVGEFLNSASSTAPFSSSGFQGFSNSGLNVSGNSNQINLTNEDFYAFSFAQKPGFFDIVTYTGDGTSNREIPHNLNHEVGMLIIKAYDTNNNGAVWHKYLPGPDWGINLFGSGGLHAAPSGWFANTAPTTSHFYVANSIASNTAGVQYVAYLFADNPEAGISVGHYTGNEVDGAIASLPWQPGMFLLRPLDATHATDWTVWSPTFGPQKYLMLNREWLGLPTSLGSAIHINEDGSVVKETLASGHEVTFNQSGKKYVYLAVTDSPGLDNQVTVDFEDLPIGSRASFSGSGISETYKGLTWGYGTSTGPGARILTPASDGSGWASETVHPDNPPLETDGRWTWNYWSRRSLWIDFGSNVTFKGFDFANGGPGEVTNPENVQVNAYDEFDQLVAQSNLLSMSDSFQSFSANYSNVRYIEFVVGNRVGYENYQYSHMPGFINIDNIRYVVPNNAPVANADDFRILSGQTYALDILLNDSDEDIDNVNINTSGTSENGALLSIENNRVHYTAPTNFTGVDSFTYDLTDVSGKQSASATVTIDVTTIPRTNLVAEYLFEDSTDLGKDTSGNGNQGQVLGDVAVGQGVYGSSALFTGDGYIEVSDGDQFSLTDNGLTISVWTKANDIELRAGIVSKGQTDIFEWSIENGLLGGGNVAGGYNAPSGSNIRYEGILGQPGQWDHYIFVFSGKSSTSPISIYRNGVLQQNDELFENANYTNAYQNTSSKLWIGQSYGGGSANPFVGEIDRIRIYEGQLSESDISLLSTEPTLEAMEVANVAPIVSDDSFTAYSNHPISLPILLNDTDEEIGSISISVPANSQAQGSLLVTESGVNYISAVDFTGNDSFTYSITDSYGLMSNTATVAIEVKPESSLVKLRPDNFFVYQMQEKALALTNNDSYDRTAGLTLQVPTTSENGGTISLTNNNALYKAADGFEGTDTFVYSIFDQDNKLLDSTLVSVHVASSGASLPLLSNMFLTPDILDPTLGTLSFDFLNVLSCSIEQEKNIDTLSTVELIANTGSYQSGNFVGQVSLPRTNLSNQLNISCIGESNVVIDYSVIVDGTESSGNENVPLIQLLTVEPQSVMLNQSQMLTVTFDNASRCLMRAQDNPSLTADRLIADNGAQEMSGSGSLTLTDTTEAKGEYLIVTCENTAGYLTQSFIKRTVNQFEIDKSQTTIGQPLTLNWQLPDIKSCNQGNHAANGSLVITDYEVSPINVIKWQCETFSGGTETFSTSYEVTKLPKAENFQAVEEVQ